MSKTIRLLIPQWQGGINPDYAFGANILAQVAPENPNEKLIKIKINENFKEKLNKENGILAGENQLNELKEVEKVCLKENPDKIIIFGGDCSVSQAPFDFLSSKYGDSLGVIWLDSHPDISTVSISSHNHELVLTNIMGLGDSVFSEAMHNPVPPNKVFYCGLVEDPLPKFIKLGDDFSIEILKPDELFSNFNKLTDWLDKNKITKLCVHFDLDVLSPEDFRSLTSTKPYQTLEEYGAAIGELKLTEVVKFLNRVNKEAEIVGLSIAEFIPSDLINLQKALSELPIFNN